jgi:hypothetical protein
VDAYARASLVLCCAIVAPEVAAAAPARVQAEPSPWHLTLDAGTDLPLAIGARLAVEAPHRLRFSTSLGGMPGGYVDLINAVVAGLGGYPDSVGDLVKAALKSSLVWNVRAGWRPFEARGFYFEIGYRLAALGGGATGEQIVTATLGHSPSRAGLTRDYEVATLVHMVDAEAGWEWLVWRDRLYLRAALGFAGTVAAHATVGPATAPRTAAGRKALAEFGAEAAAYLEDTFTSYVFTPIVSVGIGWRFY